MEDIGLLLVGFYRPLERLRSLALLAFLGTLVVLALGIGYGRAGWGTDQGFSSRYVTTAFLGICCIYMAWGVIGGETGRLVQMVLFVLAAFSLVANMRAGVEMGAPLSLLACL